ncbi:hypothetical protein A6U98_05185 [Rhizobium sp. WYCCWR10014]|nr:hypothetical protein A6U98_05185 [Rhizobium sp. WYCCWR10014]
MLLGQITRHGNSFKCRDFTAEQLIDRKVDLRRQRELQILGIRIVYALQQLASQILAGRSRSISHQ